MKEQHSALGDRIPYEDGADLQGLPEFAVATPPANDAEAGPRKFAHNDNGVGLAALATAIAAAPPVAANDDAAAEPEPPLPGAYALVPPGEWNRDDPHVVRLHAESLRYATDPTITPNERRVAAAFLSVVDGGGRLSSYAGRPAVAGFRRRYGLSTTVMAPGSPSRRLFDRLAPRFRLEEVDATVATRSGSVFLSSRRNVVSSIRGYISRLVSTGGKVPSSARGGPSVEGVAEAIGEEPTRLRWNVPARAVLRGAIADGIVELGPEFVPEDVMTDVERRTRIAEVKAVFDGFDVPGGKVPESALGRGRVDWEYCASLTGRTHPTMADEPEVRRHALEIAGRRGVMMPGLMIGVDNLAALRTWGLERVAERSASSATASAIVTNHKSVFDRLVTAAGLSHEDAPAALFHGDGFDAVLDRVLAGFGNARSAANFRRGAMKWRELHAARTGAAALPDALPDALDALFGARGVTQSAVAAMVGEKPGYIRELVIGPGSLSHRGQRVVARIEAAFDLAPGTLSSKGRLSRSRPPVDEASAEYRALPRRLRPLLPPEAARWSADRLEAAVAQVAPLMTGSTSFGRMLRAGVAKGERMPAFDPPERLRRRMAEYRAYKEAPTSWPLERARAAVWRSPLSAEMGMKELSVPFRYALAPTDGGTASGLGIDRERQTMAWLAHAPFALALFGQRSMRHADVPDDDGRPRGRTYTVWERHLAAQLLSMTNPRTGWLTQHPELARELVPLAARIPVGHDDLLRMFRTDAGSPVLTEADVELANAEWPAFVGRAHAIYQQVVDHLDAVLKVSRNPFEPIRGFVDDPEPQATLLRAIFAAEADWSDERTAPLLHRTDVRNSVALRIASATAFRPSNLVGLTFSADGRGKIRKVDGRWEISICYREFKNYRNSRLFGTATSPLDYHLVLRDEAGLYDLLDRYFFDILPALRAGTTGDAAFAGRTGGPMTGRSWYEVVRRFGRLHAAWNPVLGTGVQGVTSFNPYSFRHIRASDVLRNGTSADRIEEAAFALQTSPSMIARHYGFLLPSQATADASETFGRAVRLAWKK